MKSEKKSFATTFEEIQERQDISQTALARGARLLTPAIRRILRGKTHPHFSTFVALMTGLRLTMLDRDALELLRSAGYDLSDFSPYQQSILENWPKNEGLRISIDTLRMQVSILILISCDLLSAAPNAEIARTTTEVQRLLDELASAGTRLNNQLAAHQGTTHPYSGYRKQRRGPKED